ncbi:MAG: hypothetical protein M3237_10625 [Actinomycetota bacterium]|nr:hypothetical protein [Actinomycetota bacterium]
MSSYDDPATPAEMHADCTAVGRNLGLQRRLERAAESAVRPGPSIHFDEFPREKGKRDLRISETAARLANALHLHLD